MSKTHPIYKLDKVDLTLIKKLVSELETYIEKNETLRQEVGKDTETDTAFIIEMQKAAGLAAGIMQEGTLLMKDISAQVLTVQNIKSTGEDNSILSSLLGLSNKGIN